jgi:uncharacterized protein
VLNIAFLLLALVLILRFFRTGGQKMLKMMDEPMDETVGNYHERDGSHTGAP